MLSKENYILKDKYNEKVRKLKESLTRIAQLEENVEISKKE